MRAYRAVAKTLIMGALNATPDSFYPPSQVSGSDDVATRLANMVQDGADIIDIGGESSRPGAKPVSAEEEWERVEPVLAEAGRLTCRFSIDTRRATVARRALELGATMVNDITGLRGDPAMADLVGESGAECVIMHMQGEPETMQNDPQYADIVEDICRFFDERLSFAVSRGIPEDKIWLDPGFGFGKTMAHNFEMLRRLAAFRTFQRPVLVGTSNKSTIGNFLNTPVDDRLEGTAATVAIAIQNGADAVRVHDVKAMARVARVTDAVMGKIAL